MRNTFADRKYQQKSAPSYLVFPLENSKSRNKQYFVYSRKILVGKEFLLFMMFGDNFSNVVQK